MPLSRRKCFLSPAVGSLVAAILAAPSVARADDDGAPVYVVQNRADTMKHEVDASFGVLPLNAFTKGLTVGGSYTYHFTPMWAWEAVQFAYSFGVSTGLKDQLLTDFMVQPTQIPSLNYFGSSNVVFKPFYGKLALANRYLIHMELFLTAGGALGHFDNPGVLRGGFDAGGGLRFFIDNRFSVRVDVRDYSFIKSGGLANELFLGLSLAVNFFSSGGAK